MCHRHLKLLVTYVETLLIFAYIDLSLKRLNPVLYFIVIFHSFI